MVFVWVWAAPVQGAVFSLLEYGKGLPNFAEQTEKNEPNIRHQTQTGHPKIWQTE